MKQHLRQPPTSHPDYSCRFAIIYGGIVISLISAQHAHAQEKVLDIGTVNASESTSGESANQRRIDSAPYQAPSSAPLDATQPTSVVSQHFIENNFIKNSNYDEAIKYTPSLFTLTPSGSGLGKAEVTTIRGFQDGQYNVTFDGIPFGDATDFHHTTSAYFMLRDLGEAEVDRGPGTAETIGNATFGGTISLRSKNPQSENYVNPYYSFGSFNTQTRGLELNSGTLQNGLAFFVDVQHVSSDGSLSNDPLTRDNIFFKAVMPVSENTVLTVAATKNWTYGYTAQGALTAQLTKDKNYGLGSDPTAQNYYGYNWSNYFSDFAYVGIDSDLGNGWKVENKLYTDGFEHDYASGKDPYASVYVTGQIKYYKASTNYTTTDSTYSNDIAGKRADAKFRAWGDTLRFTKDTSYGQLKFGIWYDYNNDDRYSYTADITKGWINVPAKTTGNLYSYNFHDTLTTIQPYVQFDWKASQNLTLSPGLKEAYFERNFDASINKNTAGTPTNYDVTYKSLLPSLAAHYTISPGWSSYAQVAKGFLAPNISVLEVDQFSDIKPQQTWNYQIGTAWKSPRLALGADIYYIDFSNYIASTTVNGETAYFNGGGAIFKGVEVEATYHLGGGFSVYGNASINSAMYKGMDVYVAQTPRDMQTLGLIYNDASGWYGSLMAKRYGRQWGQDSTTDSSNNIVWQNQYPIQAFHTADLAIGYVIKKPTVWSKEIAVDLRIANLFNNRDLVGFAGTESGTNLPAYWVNPERNITLGVSFKF